MFDPATGHAVGRASVSIGETVKVYEVIWKQTIK